MAISRKRGKLIFAFSVSLLISDLVCPVVASNSNSVTENGSAFNEQEGSNPDVVLMRKHLLQLEKLEESVRNLTQIVSRMEFQLSQCLSKLNLVTPSRDEIRVSEGNQFGEKSGGGSNRGRGGELGPMLVTKHSTIWSEWFQFVSAVKLGPNSNPNFVTVLPFRDFDGLNKYFAVGDDKGRLYVFLRSGDVAAEFGANPDSDEASPVTSMVSYLSVYKNESMIVTSLENGAIVMHRVWETVSGEEWSSLNVERVRRFETTGSGGSSIRILEVHYVGRRRYILAVDGRGDIIVYREDGIIHGVATPSRRPVAFLKQRLLFLTETGAGSLDLRTMKLKESECEGLNGSFAVSYVFDAMDRTKAYGFTSGGDFIHVMLVGDAMNFKCRVRFKRKLDMEKPLALHAIKGYLLVADQEKVFVYNVSTQHYVRVGAIRLVFHSRLDEIVSSFVNQKVVVDHDNSLARPSMASDYEKDIVIGLGNGYVAMYRSNLPVIKHEFNSIWWTSPVLFFVLFLFVAWHFFANKKEALTSWGPDIPFSPTPAPSDRALTDASRNSSLVDPSRNSDIMDLRSAGLRSSSRYVSPTRYPTGASSSYRPGHETDAPRPAPVDPRFRPTSELKYRGANTEPAGMPNRRDMRYVNSNVVVDDSS